jgi:aminoglycoside phosphotransferase (APT) family kinase protein
MKLLLAHGGDPKIETAWHVTAPQVARWNRQGGGDRLTGMASLEEVDAQIEAATFSRLLVSVARSKPSAFRR